MLKATASGTAKMMDRTQMEKISMAVKRGMPTLCTLFQDATALYLSHKRYNCKQNSQTVAHLFQNKDISLQVHFMCTKHFCEWPQRRMWSRQHHLFFTSTPVKLDWSDSYHVGKLLNRCAAVATSSYWFIAAICLKVDLRLMQRLLYILYFSCLFG